MINQTQEANQSSENSSQESATSKGNDYGSPEYWQQRYLKAKGERFDWLENYQTLKAIIEKYYGENKGIKILNIGCGNGQVQDHLYNAGYHQIHNNDISKQVITQMNEIKKEKKQDGMVYEVMDVTAMTYPDQQFDMVLDKSTIDALLCSQNPYINTAKMVEQVERVLKDDGLYLIISYASNRLPHLVREHISFAVQIETLTRKNSQGHQLVHYAYICRKKPGKIPMGEEQRKQFYENLQKLEDADYQ